MSNDLRRRNAYLADQPERTKDLLLSEGRWREAFPNGLLGDVSALTFSWAHQIALLEGDLHISVRGGKVWVRSRQHRRDYLMNFSEGWELRSSSSDTVFNQRPTLRLIVDGDREFTAGRAIVIYTMALTASLGPAGSVSLDGELLYYIDGMFSLTGGLLQINPGQILSFQNVTGTVEYCYA